MYGFESNILIFCEQITHRFQYVLEWVFHEQLDLDFRVTFDREEWKQYQGLKINYSENRIETEDIAIRPHKLIYESGVVEQQLNINRWKKNTVIFYNQPGALVPFDIFSAIFYLISRYEEYLPHKNDAHGRFDPVSSVAYQYSFLQQPIIDEWLLSFKLILEKKFSVFLPKKQFKFLPTYDIDFAWAYLNKSKKQIWGGALRDLFRLKLKWFFDRLAVATKSKTDPYDAFAWMEDAQKFYALKPIYFFLVGKKGPYDRNINPNHPAMNQLIQHTSNHAQVGLHPSYNSFCKLERVKEERDLLTQILDKPINHSRQHYLKMKLPQSYHLLLDLDIHNDYTMGYGTVNGFRAGTSNSFLWYDLSKEIKTSLRVHPFCLMDSTSINAYGKDKESAFKEVERLVMSVKKVGGSFISIFHNNNLGRGRENKGWHKFYQKLIELIQQQ
ncbi:MAG TPA: polysaccharide deacetylase family protein [Edaphocola sp.]|nr:polysaccharide deacetylase family protein [Edaphocola sp.]